MLARLLAPLQGALPSSEAQNTVFLGQSVRRFDAGLSHTPAPALAVPIDLRASQLKDLLVSDFGFRISGFGFFWIFIEVG